MLENGQIPVEDRKGWDLAHYTGIPDFFTIPWLRYQHAEMFRQMDQYEHAISQPESEQRAHLQAFDAATRALAKPNLATLVGPALVKVSESKQRQLALIRSTIVALAVERYRIAHDGHWPDSLDQLKGKQLEAMPLDPYVGQPLKYRKVADGVIVYSVGADRVDNEGDLDVTGQRPGLDVGIRLWNPDMRRQPAPKRLDPPNEPDLGVPDPP